MGFEARMSRISGQKLQCLLYSFVTLRKSPVNFEAVKLFPRLVSKKNVEQGKS